MKLAIFGGTFDPIHNAHLTIAREAARRCGPFRVLFVPAASPPHKAGFTHASYADRLRMVEIACAGEALFEASRLEQGTPSSYSIFTIEKVRAGLGEEDRLYFLIGADAFAGVQTWHRWREVIAMVEFIVVDRPSCLYSVPDGARVHQLEGLGLPISSSEVRRKLARGEGATEVPEGVLRYIREHGLYGSA